MSSESNDEEKPPPLPVPAAAAAAANCVDLTLSDSDDDDDAPSPTCVAPHDGRKSGSYANFSKYATSLRKRVATPRKRSAEDDATPKVVTPRRRRKKKASSTSISSDTLTSAKFNGIQFGAIGYKFHKIFFVGDDDKGEKKAMYFHGEVIEIVDGAVAKKGKDRRCKYHDGDEEDLSLMELRPLPRCTKKDCLILLSAQFTIKNHNVPFGEEGGNSPSCAAASIGMQDESERENDGLKEDSGSPTKLGENGDSGMDVDEEHVSSGDDNKERDGMSSGGDNDSQMMQNSDDDANSSDGGSHASSSRRNESPTFQVDVNNCAKPATESVQDDHEVAQTASGDPQEESDEEEAGHSNPSDDAATNKDNSKEIFDQDKNQTNEDCTKSATSSVQPSHEVTESNSNTSDGLQGGSEEVDDALVSKKGNSKGANYLFGDSSDEDESISSSRGQGKNLDTAVGSVQDKHEARVSMQDEPVEEEGTISPSNPAGAMTGNEKKNEDEKSSLNVNEEIDNGTSQNVNEDLIHNSDDDELLPSSDDEDQVLNSNNEVHNSDDDELLPSSDDDEQVPNSKEQNPEYNSDDDELLPSSDDEGQLSNLKEQNPNYNSDDDELLASSDDEDQILNSNHQIPNFSDDEELLPSSDDEEVQNEEVQKQFFNGQIGNSLEDHDNESTCSRFSDVSGGDPPQTKKRPTLDFSKSLVSDCITPPVEREDDVVYYFAEVWGARMRVKETKASSDLPPATFSKDGYEYEILYNKYIARKGKGPSEDNMGDKYKSFYLAVSGPGLDRIDLKSALASIADFESLTYEKGTHKTVSRLDLLVSPCCRSPVGKTPWCMHRLNENLFELVEDNGHLGCGFIPKWLLEDLLGGEKYVGPKRAFAIQVRIIGPTLCIAKGMLYVKDGIDKIQVPTSMVKVKKSKTQPLHKYVSFVVIQQFPWINHRVMGKLLDDNEKDPTEKQKQNLKTLSTDTQRVLHLKGVENDTIEQYINDKRHNHACLVGVCHGSVPEGHVFIPGMRDKLPSRVFLTRNPCTEGKDGIVVKVASSRNMSKKAFRFLDSRGFGAVVFPLGENPLPPTINEGDLDGDPYGCIWDDALLDGITVDDHIDDESLGQILSDNVVGIEFQYEIDGHSYDSLVVKKLQENPDMYLVETGKRMKTQVRMTREAIFEGKDVMSEVVGHRSPEGAGHKSTGTKNKAGRRSKGAKKTSLVEFNCRWESGESQWKSIQDIRECHKGGPPPALMSYVASKGLLENGELPESFCKWIKDHLGEEEVLEVTNHRTVADGNTEVLCRFSDGDEQWQPLEEAKEDCKIFLGEYARKNDLFGQPGWEDVDGYWLAEVQDLMCTKTRAREISLLKCTLYRMWKNSFDECGGHHPDTVIWGRVYKLSNEIEKHGGVVKLPLHLWLLLSDKIQKYAEIL